MFFARLKELLAGFVAEVHHWTQFEDVRGAYYRYLGYEI